ncbi:MAG: hypothetical protein GC159_15325 [Phycisphaera sp.]|nr:hypothetical protein [Phycisphaera sp.]
MMHCVIWARVSSREQREGYSIDAQLRVTRERADKEGWPIAREFVVAESAKRGAERQVFNQMLKWVKANARKQKIGFILAHKLDRTCRNIRDAVRLQELEDTCDVKLAFVENHFGPGAAGALSFNVMAAVAQYYSDNLRAEVLKGIEEKVRQGWAPGLAAFGYVNVAGDRENPVQLHPVNSNAVRRIFELYATGTKTFEQIGDIMRREGYAYRPSEPRFHRTAVGYILHNPFYTGMVRFRGDLYVGKHEPLIDKATFDECQRLLKRKNRRTNKINHYLAGGMFVCGHCGFGITGEKVVRRQKNGNVHQYVYYRCANVYPEADHPVVRWREEQLEEAILTDLKSLRIEDEEDRQWFRDNLVASLGNEEVLRGERLKSLRRRLADLEAKQKRLLDAYLAGAVDKNTFTATSAQIKEETQKTEEDLQTSKAGPLTGFERVLEVFDLAQVAAERWEVLDKAGRREILDTILLKRTLNATSLETTKKKPFDVFAKGLFSDKSRGDRI